MNDKDTKKKIEEDIKGFNTVRNLDEAEVYFTQLPAKHHPFLVDKLILFAVESKEADAQLFSRASTKNLCTIAAFESGFGVLEFLDDIADEQLRRSALKTDSSAKLLELIPSCVSYCIRFILWHII